MRFTIAALAALVASATAARVDPPGSVPLNLNLDQSFTFGMDGDSRGTETLYFYLTNWRTDFPGGTARPCVYLGSAPRNAISLTIPARTARGTIPYQSSGYQIRMYSPNQSGCGNGFLAQNTDAFEATAYNNP
ncbi:hypothetical protein BJX63DRAFT_434135 [Aspergillus granulosus]|uniref:Uncharacterized protein n=1 Tax=Aspergillus granulosus TaxID=176169 RepID=A0ABR4H574_9EURO